MTVSLLGAARLRSLLDEAGARPVKALGQNFVIDPNTIRKVLDVAQVGEGDRVLEIGAGVGSLTLGLASAGAEVVAVEVDPRLVPVLRSQVEGLQVEVVEADALTFDLSGVDATRLVANLPYNIAAAVVVRVLEEAPQIEHLSVMTQREVGERLAAPPGSRTFGRTSLLVAYFASARVAAQISRKAFYPVPNVDSVLVRIDRRASPAVPYGALKQVVGAGFAQRRKMLRSALATLMPGDEAAAVLDAAGIDGTRRAETLSLDDVVALTNAWEDLRA